MAAHASATTCPHCGMVHEVASNIQPSKGKPEAGDVTLCIECGRWGLFDEALQLRKPTLDEMQGLARNVDLQRLHMAWWYATKPKEHPWKTRK
jgi:hypothetical protein